MKTGSKKLKLLLAFSMACSVLSSFAVLGLLLLRDDPQTDALVSLVFPPGVLAGADWGAGAVLAGVERVPHRRPGRSAGQRADWAVCSLPYQGRGRSGCGVSALPGRGHPADGAEHSIRRVISSFDFFYDFVVSSPLHFKRQNHAGNKINYSEKG